MAAITPQQATSAGLTLTMAAASGGGDTVLNYRGNAHLVIQNSGGGSINVTITAVITTRPAQGAYPSQTISNIVKAVPNDGKPVIIPIPYAYNSPTTRSATITYSGVTSVTVGAFLPGP